MQEVEIADFVQRAVRKKEPVREAVRANWTYIQAALNAGATIGSIRRTLQEDGIELGGRSRSGFNAAVHHVRREMTAISSADLSSLGDGRRKSAW